MELQESVKQVGMVVVKALYVLYALIVFLLIMLIILPAAFVATFFGRIKGMRGPSEAFGLLCILAISGLAAVVTTVYVRLTMPDV